MRQSSTHSAIALLLLAIVLPASGQPLPALHDSILIGGTGGWDYVTCDTNANRLYVSHEERVEVVDLTTRKRIGSVEGTVGVHGIVIAGKGFTTNGKDATVTVFDPATLREVKRIPLTGKKPDAILFEPVSGRVFTFNGGSGNCSAIDTQSLDDVGTLRLNGAPESAVAEGTGMVFVNIEDKNEVVKFDASSLHIEARWPLSPGATPTGLAIDRTNHRLFAGCRNQLLIVLDANTGTVVTSVPIGKGVDGVSFDTERQMIYVSNKDGTLDIIRQRSPLQYEHVASIPTIRGAKTMALDERHHRVYLPASRPSADGARGDFRVYVVE